MLAPEPVAGYCEGGCVGHRRARAEVARRRRKPEQVGEPAERDLLELDGGRPERPHADVLVDCGRPRFDDRGGGERRAGDVAEVATAGRAGETAGAPLVELAEDALDGNPVLGKRLLEAGAQRRGVELRSRPRRRLEGGAEALGEIGDRSVEVAAYAGELDFSHSRRCR